jgi:Holliday junction DNA helicase RuvA
MQATVVSIKDYEVILQIDNISFISFIPRSHLLNNGCMYTFKTHLAWNSDQGPTLYGFQTHQEYDIFILLLSCSGIGAKMALSIIHTIPIEIIKEAIVEQKPKILTDAPGIGLKKAEMIILELKNKINTLCIESEKNSSQAAIYSDLIATLEHLGYTNVQIHNALKEIDKLPDIKTQPLVNLIRHAVSIL